MSKGIFLVNAGNRFYLKQHFTLNTKISVAKNFVVVLEV